MAGRVLGGRFIAKFAWSRPAAVLLAHEIGTLTALTREPRVPFLPEVVASSTDPLLLVTRLVPGTSLFEVADSIDRDHAGWQLACFLAALHQPAARRRAEAGSAEVWDHGELRLVVETSRPSEPSSQNMTCGPFPALAWVLALS